MYDTMILANKKSRSQPQNNAWDNKKKKTIKKTTPRGNVFKRLEQRESSSWWHNLNAGLL
jgi:hypothetical protein